MALKTCFFSDEEWNRAELDSSLMKGMKTPQRPLMKNLCWKIAVLLGIVCVDWVAREHDSLAKNPFRGTSDARVKFILRTQCLGLFKYSTQMNLVPINHSW